MEDTNNDRFSDLIELIKNKIIAEEDFLHNQYKFQGADKYCLIVSASDMNNRAVTKTLWLDSLKDDSQGKLTFVDDIESLLTKIAKKFTDPLVTCRIEWVTSSKLTTWSTFIENLKSCKRNYYRKGIAFEGLQEPWLLITEMELNANSCLYQGGKHSRAKVHERHFERYFKKRHGSSQIPDYKPDLKMQTFNTAGWCFDARTHEYHELNTLPRHKGRRHIPRLEADTTLEIVTQSAQYLANQIQDSGQYIYGRFACFNRNINFYNNLRHASSSYALIEAFELCRDQSTLSAESLVQLKAKIDKSLDYLTNKVIQHYGDKAYVVDVTEEIKLGANAVAILAYVKYMQVFAEAGPYEEYLDLSYKLAAGIEAMQQEDGSFVHVLHPESLKVKQKTRIIYYDGEAAFGLMRLYGLTRDERWLDCVVRAFDYFIAAEHYKAHDHWLSYCSNELVIYKPEKKYFQFAVNNVKGYTDFIKNRITTYPTLLELSMAFHKMLITLEAYPEYHDVLDEFDIVEFYEALHARANYLLNGFFFPEVAMFYQSPKTIEHGFFIRHHAFRVRIDDVEHYLSGYVHYYGLLAEPKYPKTFADFSEINRPEPNSHLGADAKREHHNTSIIAWGGDINLDRRQHYKTQEFGVDKVLDIPALKAADYTIVNLKCVISLTGEQGREKGEGGPYYYRARPEMLQILKEAGVDAVTCANNHSGDYGSAALIEQVEILKAADIDYVGTGKTIPVAFAPIYHTLPNGVQLALFNVDTTSRRYSVSASRPGAAYINPRSHQLWQDIYQPLFEREKSAGRLVLLAIHWGTNGRNSPDKDEMIIGHQLIDAGADAILGTWSQRLQGIEVYKGKPIIYDAGELLIDSVVGQPKDGGVFELRVTEQGIEAVTMSPVVVGFGQTTPREGRAAFEASRRFAKLCHAMGSPVKIDDDGRTAILLKDNELPPQYPLAIHQPVKAKS